MLATLDQHRSHRDPAHGYGIVNAYRAVTAAVPARRADPVYAAADPFLRRARRFANGRVAPLPPAAGRRADSVGQFSIGNAPRLFVPRVLGGIGVAAAGLLRCSCCWWAWPCAAAGAGIRCSPRPSRCRPCAKRCRRRLDADGVAWHEISEPPDSEPGPFIQ